MATDDEQAILAECWRLVDRGEAIWVSVPPDREPEYMQGDLLSDAYEDEPPPW